MQFVFSKIYVKFFIIQINSSISYYNYLKQNKELNELDLNLNSDFNSSEKNYYNNDEFLDVDIEDLEFDEESAAIDDKYKKYFLYKNKIFSKVEVIGIVIEIKTIGHENKNYRHIIFLDDTTSMIQCICWNNKNKIVFENLKNQVVSTNAILI